MVTSNSASPPLHVVRGLPFLGSLIPFARDPLAFVDHLRLHHGDRVLVRLVRSPVLFLQDPSDIERVLVKYANRLHKDEVYEELRPALGNGLLTAEDEAWRRNRKLVAPSLSARHVESYAASMVRCTRDATDRLSRGEIIDLRHLLIALTRDIALVTLFGEGLSVDVTPVADALDAVMDQFVHEVQGFNRLLPKSILTPGRRRAYQAIAKLDQTAFAVIEERSRVGLGDDLLSRLIEARDESGTGFTQRELRDEVTTAFLAGHETTALALTYTFLLLSDHPEVRQRVRDEVHAVLGDRDPTVEDCRSLRFTKAVIQESLRLYPPAWGIGREVIEPVPLPGLELPVGWQVLITPWTLHRDERWFDDPLTFRPDRWLDEASVASLPRLAYQPFGGGPRVCIGKHFAMLEAVIVLAALMQRVSFDITGPWPPLMPSITLRPTAPVRAQVQGPSTT